MKILDEKPCRFRMDLMGIQSANEAVSTTYIEVQFESTDSIEVFVFLWHFSGRTRGSLYSPMPRGLAT